MPKHCDHWWRLDDPEGENPREVVYTCAKCEAQRTFPLTDSETPASARNRIITALQRGEALEAAADG